MLMSRGSLEEGYERPYLPKLSLPSLELRRLHFDLVWTSKIIFGHVDMRFDVFLS